MNTQRHRDMAAQELLAAAAASHPVHSFAC